MDGVITRGLIYISLIIQVGKFFVIMLSCSVIKIAAVSRRHSNIEIINKYTGH